MSAFTNQLNSKDEFNLFKRIEIRTRCEDSKQGIADQFDKTLKQFPDAERYQWFNSLKEAVLDFCEKEGEPRSVSDYLEAMEDIYTGSTVLIGLQEVKGLSAFAEEELDQPHMQWLKPFDSRYKAYRVSYPDLKASSCLRMAAHKSFNGVTDDELYKLRVAFIDMDFEHFGLGFADWIKWFESSKNYFDGNNQIKQESAEKMLKTLKVWLDSGSTNIKEWLCRNYEIHPFHSYIADELIEKAQAQAQAQA
ncbi:hypothetical protein [Photobacterium damselae]|uniref:hypothetical protein n=1 Tax=Photobacterium damselae TaxID=38293 RepID=UPI001F22FCCC|nr:hypothetical protein [Photobacterium damselae]UKA04949.1 hypothetical protein IHC89_22145 [Photobacterium damselae subsp. damselae]